jgi:hypothetical protein
VLGAKYATPSGGKASSSSDRGLPSRSLDGGFDEESAFGELKDSVRACGVKDPVKIRPTPEAARPFALVSGFRRYAASEELALGTIPEKRYPKARALFITADAGGSNSYRSHVWKFQLQRLAVAN